MVTILLSCLLDKLTQPIIELLIVSNIEVNGPLVVTRVGLLSMLALLLPDIDRPCSTFGCVLRNRAEFGSIQLTVARQREARAGLTIEWEVTECWAGFRKGRQTGSIIIEQQRG